MATAKAVERAYEALVIFPSDTPQKSIDGYVEKIKGSLAQSNGTLRGVQVWGRRRLTYPIKHNRDGLYVYLDFNAGNKAAENLNSMFRISDLVLRHLITDRREYKEFVPRKPELAAAPAPAGAPVAAPAADASAGAPSAQ